MGRNVNDLLPCVREKLNELQAEAMERGIEFIVTCTFRTAAEQRALFAQGRRTLQGVNRLRLNAGMAPITATGNKIVTNDLTSIHMYGCAFDVALLNTETNKPTWDIEADFNKNGIPDYNELGKLGESIGLKWGGAFKSKDYCHFEYPINENCSFKYPCGTTLAEPNSRRGTA